MMWNTIPLSNLELISPPLRSLQLRRVRDELSRTRFEADETLKHELEDLRNRLRDEARQSRYATSPFY
jgi:hypothetical protein